MNVMEVLFKAVGLASQALAAATKLILGGIVLVVIADVALRNLNYRPIAWGVSATEYALLFAAFLPMPWLVRTKGHIFVEFFRKPMPPAVQAVMAKAVYVTCILLCLYLTWYAASAMITGWRTGAFETRTFDMPRWLIHLPMVLGFFLSSLEWLRYLVGLDDLYDYDPLEQEGL